MQLGSAGNAVFHMISKLLIILKKKLKTYEGILLKSKEKVFRVFTSEKNKN